MVLVLALSLAGPLSAQDFRPSKEAVERPKSDYSPYPEQNFPNRLYWGDTHLHTSYSTDAGMAGQTVGPDDTYRSPGGFTAFIGFEWTSHPSGDNLHRVVVFRDAAERALQTIPFSAYDSEDREKLWEYMAAYEKKTGGRMLAIPHNGNLSNGRFFELQKFDGSPLDAAYARERARREPLVEVTRAKGTGEAHPFLSSEDEFAEFELLDVSKRDPFRRHGATRGLCEHRNKGAGAPVRRFRFYGCRPRPLGLRGARLCQWGSHGRRPERCVRRKGP